MWHLLVGMMEERGFTTGPVAVIRPQSLSGFAALAGPYVHIDEVEMVMQRTGVKPLQKPPLDPPYH